ncbi:hypothetical protein CHS0354_011750 [Potamilus streckersoni]|uniref:Uncharacterized protein n=1 Tax=Potamilus streckersoni TaxID=2493646 RepID=A0AAE0TBC3_9BIVA|nr:hypothetical protein CHS0354_011750 [Potamilus streckersoni]
MQDLWDSDTSRLRDSDYTISSTGNRVVGQAEELTIVELAEVDAFMHDILTTSVMSKTYTFPISNARFDSNSIHMARA